MNAQNILEQMTIVSLNISTWNGRKTLKDKDLTAIGIRVKMLPADTVASLGSKRIISRKLLKLFSVSKRTAIEVCRNNGIRIGGEVYAIPRERADEVCNELMLLKEAFNTEKERLLSASGEEVESWITSKLPAWKPLIDVLHPDNLIRKAISFNYAAFDVNASAGMGEESHDEVSSNLYGQLCHEIRVTTRAAFDNSFVGKQGISWKTLRPIKAIRAKLEGLAFLHPSIAETIQLIDDTMDKLPKKGIIKGTDLNMVAGLVGRQLANMGNVTVHSIEGDEDEEAVEEDVTTTADSTGKVAPISWDF